MSASQVPFDDPSVRLADCRLGTTAVSSRAAPIIPLFVLFAVFSLANCNRIRLLATFPLPSHQTPNPPPAWPRPAVSRAVPDVAGCPARAPAASRAPGSRRWPLLCKLHLCGVIRPDTGPAMTRRVFFELLGATAMGSLGCSSKSVFTEYECFL